MSTNILNTSRIKKLFKDNQERVLFLLIIILVAVISFRAGQLKEKELKSASLKVLVNNKVLPEKTKKAIALGEAIQRRNLKIETKEEDVSDNKVENCKYVGSSNSDKYHQMSCRWANQIKLENRVCFKSVEEAEKMGYKPASCNK